MQLINLKNRKNFSSDFLAICSEKGNIIIDAGFYNDEVKENLKNIGNIDAILLTHGHWDHIQALDEIKLDFPYAKVYIHEKDYGFLRDEDLNLSLKHKKPFRVESDAIKLNEGIFNLGKYEIELIHTPGHTGGSCMYYFRDEDVLFTGDTIGPEVIGNSFYPTGSDEDMSNSLRKFKNLKISDQTMCYSSHWGFGTYEEILRINQYLNMMEEYGI